MFSVAKSYDACDNCGSERGLGCCSLDGLGFCCEECLDTYLNGGPGILSANPQDRFRPEPYKTSFYVHNGHTYVLKANDVASQDRGTP